MTPEEMEIQRLRRENEALRALRKENESLRFLQKLDMAEKAKLRRIIELMEEAR